MSQLGEIYCLTSPSGKKYIGQCVKYLSSGKKWGYISRWKDHVRDSKTQNYCRLLNNAIIKYGEENFKVELITECDIKDMNQLESHYISTYNTLSPNGYNLTDGGSEFCRQSEETKELKRKSMIGKNKGKIYQKRIRKREQDNDLPKYVRYYTDKTGKEGYRVSNHPTLKDKSFLNKIFSLEYRLEQAINYLNQ